MYVCIVSKPINAESLTGEKGYIVLNSMFSMVHMSVMSDSVPVTNTSLEQPENGLNIRRYVRLVVKRTK